MPIWQNIITEEHLDLVMNLRGYFEKVSIQATGSTGHKRKIIRTKAC